MTKLLLTAADGYLLSALYAKPVAQYKGTIVISPATGIKKEYYINFAMYLVQAGYNVLLYDYRGIGESAPAQLRSFKHYMHEWGTKDMQAVLDFLTEEKKLTNIIWIGHSAGAQLVGFLKNSRHISKIISVSSALGYWGYFPIPQKWLIWFLWKFTGPLMLIFFGYGKMKLIGWGENLPPNMLKEWRSWCLSKNYFQHTIEKQTGKERFYDISIPLHSIYMSDDFIANDKTVPLMTNFFPNAQHFTHKIMAEEFTTQRVGHIGMFRKKFENSLWPLLVSIIDESYAVQLPAVNSACD